MSNVSVFDKPSPYRRPCSYIVYFWFNNGEQIVTLPVVPPDFPMNLPEQNNEIYSGLSLDYNRIGTYALQKMSWSSFFPVCKRRQPYMPEGAFLDGWKYIQFFKEGRDRKIPFRIMVWDVENFSMRLNMPCTVDSLDYTVARNGYIHYTISLTEYRFIE